MDQIIIGNKKYNIHPQNLLFGVDRDGNVIDIIKRNTIDVNREDMTIKLRKVVGKSKKIKIDKYIWEAFNGVKPKGTTIVHINGNKEDNGIDNLKLRKGGKERKLSDEERYQNDEACKARWKQKEWICPKCGRVTNNNASGYHKRVCTLSDKQYSDADKQKQKENNSKWANRLFKCETCNNEYKNSYKYLHTIICEKRMRAGNQA